MIWPHASRPCADLDTLQLQAGRIELTLNTPLLE
jgi:hypothetical protein